MNKKNPCPNDCGRRDCWLAEQCMWALEARAVLELIASPKRPDGTWNRDREACRQLAAEVLAREGKQT